MVNTSTDAGRTASRSRPPRKTPSGGRKSAATIAAESDADRVRTDAQARADAERALGEAAGAAEQARMAALQDVPVGILTALALRELAGSLPRIEHLTVTPDLLTDLVGRLGAREGR